MTTTKPILALVSGLLASAVLSGCVGGTTYGTGVAQEEATVEDLANILAIRKKQKKQIEYDPRPDLVIPEDKQLVEPSQNADTGDQAWPETPEERIAQVRQEATEAQTNTVDQLKFGRTKKRFQAEFDEDDLARGNWQAEAPPGHGIPNVSCDPDGIVMRQCNAVEISRAVRLARNEIASVGKTGYQRRYLTEPPIEYRTYSQDAPIGDQGYTEEELARIEAERKRKQFQAATKPSL